MPPDQALLMFGGALIAAAATVALIWATGTPVAALAPVTLAAALALRLGRK
ncbi:hypothetical protein [Frigidibacter sp. MR17.24]|uniref:hypothetical protein n=1 Tax=Frigidibacter sp. MR17.24 TaxID=3127345 RepID=UPI003012A185